MGSWLHSAFEWLSIVGPFVAVVSVEVAIVGAIVAYLQLRYAKRRDKAMDTRSAWTEIHKAMLEFRFRREILNNPDPRNWGNTGAEAEAAVEALEALHNLKGQLDRSPDWELVKEIADFLNENEEAERWRSPDFQKRFDEYAKTVAPKARPDV